MKGAWVIAINVTGVVLAVGLGLLGLIWSGQRPSHVTQSGSAPNSVLQIEVLPDGQRALRDASGSAVPLKAYHRIASGSTIADALLLEFASPNQIAAFTTYSDNNEWFGYLYEGKPHVDPLKELERLIALSPDLLVVSTLSSGARLERLRET